VLVSQTRANWRQTAALHQVMQLLMHTNIVIITDTIIEAKTAVNTAVASIHIDIGTKVMGHRNDVNIDIGNNTANVYCAYN
jgi:hypothetical protein